MGIALDELHLWPVYLDQEVFPIARFESFLSADERSRADRFVTAELRQRYVVCRGALRELLASEIKTTPEKLVLDYQQWGKPILRKPRSPVRFNVSHSAAWGLIGLAYSEIGVDIEIPQSRTNHRAIASQVLHPQEAEINATLPPRDFAENIMRLWVVKEALLKALGLGIAEGLQQTSFPMPIPNETFQPLSISAALQEHLEDDGSCRMNDWTDAATWRIELVQPNVGDCYAAVAMHRSVTRVVLHDAMYASG